MRKKLFCSLLVLCLTFLGVLFWQTKPAHAAFYANNLMDNGVFDNVNSMTGAQPTPWKPIDDWLNNNFPQSCISTNNGFLTPDLVGYSPSQGYLYGGNVSAGTAIYHAAQAYGINPQVLIATLQKESSVVSGDATYHCQYINTAMGYDCPDSGSCPRNPATESGFSKQIIHAAWLLRFHEQRSKGNVGWQETHPGWDNSDDPQSCYSGRMTQGTYQICPSGPSNFYDGMYTIDATAVHMDTGATAALYDYTPHFHGNQNFVSIFESWFGSTIGDLVRTPGGGVYKIESGVKRAFPDEIIFLSYFYRWSDVVTISSTELSQIPDGAVMTYNTHFRDGVLVTSPSGGMYVVENGLKRPFPNEGTFLSYGYKWTDALVISNAEMSLILVGAAMPYNVHLRDGVLVTSPSGGMYVVENGLKRPFPNEGTFLSYGYKWTDALVISNAEMSLILVGAAMPYNVHFRDGKLVKSSSNGGIYLIENGLKRPITSDVAFLSYSYKWSDVLTVSPTELSLIPDGAAMPYNVHFRDGKLVKSSSNGGIYLIENGLKRPFPSVTIFLNHSYKWSDVLTVSPTELSLIPDGAVMA